MHDIVDDFHSIHACGENPWIKFCSDVDRSRSQKTTQD